MRPQFIQIDLQRENARKYIEGLSKAGIKDLAAMLKQYKIKTGTTTNNSVSALRWALEMIEDESSNIKKAENKIKEAELKLEEARRELREARRS